MYEVDWEELLVVHDAHPQYASTAPRFGLGVLADGSRAASPRAHWPRCWPSAASGRSACWE